MAARRTPTQIASASNAWAAWAERLWRVAQALGLDGWIKSVVWLAAASIGTFAVSVRPGVIGIPWWGLVLIGLTFATLTLHVFAKLRSAWAIRGMKTLDIQQFARECTDFYKDFSGFMVARIETSPPRFARDDPEGAHRDWQASVAYSQTTNARALEKFGPRVYSIAHRMAEFGIRPPALFHFPHGDVGGAALYIGTVGDLLEKGLLAEARKLDPKSTWGAGFR
jgi:hypothetical protein